MAVLVSEEDHDRQAADDDALQHQQDGPEHHVQRGDAGGAGQVRCQHKSTRTAQTCPRSPRIPQHTADTGTRCSGRTGSGSLPAHHTAVWPTPGYSIFIQC